jgi:carbon-monoxide dehydrogenase large subunit
VSYLGQSVRRIEDWPLLTGRARFVADVSFPGQLFMRVVRSPVASGRIIRVDAVFAKEMPGVVAVWSADDVAHIPPIDFRMTIVPGLEPYRQPILATGYVRYVGEPVAVVFADDPYLAEDAADAVFIDIDEVDPDLDPTNPGRFHPDLTAEAAIIVKEYGDLEHAFAHASEIVELRLSVGRHSGVPMETRGAVATWDSESGSLRMYGAAKVPHYNRKALASMLDLEQERVHLHEGHVGGGFGVRGELYPEDVLVCAATMNFGRPVKWIEDRREHLIATNHSRDQIHRIRAAVGGDGFILGIDDEFWQDQGGYVRTHAVTVSDLTAALLAGPYVVPAFRSIGHVILTNKTPAGTYRAPGRYEGSFVRERLFDAIAARLEIDPVELRRANLIGPDQMPFERGVDALGTSVVYDSGRYGDALDTAITQLGYLRLREEIAERRHRGELVGLGVAFFVEKSGLGPNDEVRVAIGRAGNIEVVTGAASLGQGMETVVAQVCADYLGADMAAIRVIHGQTDLIAQGMGAFASRVTVMTGSATARASADLKVKVLAVAGDLLEADPADLDLTGGLISVKDSPGSSRLTLAEVAEALAEDSEMAARHGSQLEATSIFATTHMTYPYGVHAVVVEIDPDTYECRVVRYLVVYDVGRAINPMLIDGQIVGAAAQGIGGALFEEFVYDDNGQPLATSFMDYLMPTVSEMPEVISIITEIAPSPLNPLGVKGAGEGGINAAGAAIAAAVDDALGIPGAVTALPISPDRIRELLHGRRHACSPSGIGSGMTGSAGRPG